MADLLPGEPSIVFPVLVETAGVLADYHAEICSINFKALYCSCGAVLTGSYPLWEVDP